MKINENNISNITFNPNTHYIRSDLNIVDKKKWNSRNWLERLLDWMARVTVNPLKVAPVIKTLVDRVCDRDELKIPFKNINRNFQKFQKGLLNQLKPGSSEVKRKLNVILEDVAVRLQARITQESLRASDGFIYL